MYMNTCIIYNPHHCSSVKFGKIKEKLLPALYVKSFDCQVINKPAPKKELTEEEKSKKHVSQYVFA